MNDVQAPQVAPCLRCGYLCHVEGTAGKPNAAPWPPTVRLSSTPNGMCLECAVHWLLFTVDGFRWTFEQGNGLLHDPDVQQMVGKALAVGSPEVDPTKINWTRLLEQWDMAWPESWPLPKDQSAVERSVKPRKRKRWKRRTHEWILYDRG